MPANKTLYILYNADASVMGKLKYGYKKLRAAPDCEPACAACDITHGGLSLNESAEWVNAKKEIEAASDLKIVQWHRDEIAAPLKKFVEGKQLRYPAVVLQDGDGDDAFTEVMNSSELAACNGKADQFVAGIKAKGLMS